MKWRTRGLLFDMDGVLISSLGSVERSWARWGEMRGVDGAGAIKHAHGKRAIDIVRMLRPDLDDQAELKIVEEMEVEDYEGLEVLRGVERIVHSLPQQYWTIVTSATDRLARSRLGHAAIPVPEHFVNADMVTRGKPDPEPYLKGAALLGLDPGECVVIEDASAGVEAGHRAGCKVIATLFSHAPEHLSLADWVVDSLDDLDVEVLPNGAGLELSFEPVMR
ncbi:MAG TPA: HAD-IA family hydrolase [Acidisarcina sp.]